MIFFQDDTDPNYAKGFGFDDKSIRAGFIRRVYSILSVSLKFNWNNCAVSIVEFDGVEMD